MKGIAGATVATPRWNRWPSAVIASHTAARLGSQKYNLDEADDSASSKSSDALLELGWRGAEVKPALYAVDQGDLPLGKNLL
jgi:hypothetical protein